MARITWEKTKEHIKRWQGSLGKWIDGISMKKMALSAGLLFALSLIPILLLGRYNVMCVDDYDYGKAVHDTWLATGSFWKSVSTAWQQNMEFYRQWQGTYISCFLMGMCPMNFYYEIAFVVPFIMVGMFAVSTFLLGRHILYQWLGVDKTGSSFVMFMLLFTFYQVLEAPFEGIYWYNGATHYVLMESVLFLGLYAISMSLWAKDRRKEAVWCVAATVLSVIVGGGNLVTGLQAEIVMALLVLYALAANRKKIVAVAVPFVVGSIGFLINILAPGNTLRGNLDTDEGYSAVAAVLLSFYHGVVFIIQWTPAFVILLWLMLLPALWRLVKRSERQFCHPVWVSLGAFCLVSAMFTPTLYAIGMVGLSRVDNIIQMVYYLCLIMVTAYWLGYFAHKEDVQTVEAADGGPQTKTPEGMVKPLMGDRCAGSALGCFLEKTGNRMMAVGMLLMLTMWVLTADKNTYTSISALRSLANGEAQTFYAEAMERHEIYVDEDIVDVVVKPYSARPALFDFNDLTQDAGNWLNLAVMKYYNKAYVKVAE